MSPAIWPFPVNSIRVSGLSSGPVASADILASTWSAPELPTRTALPAKFSASAGRLSVPETSAASDAERRVATLARWVLKKQATEVHIRHLQRKVRLPGLRDAGTIKETCERMIEAGHAFGFVGLNLFRRIVLPPVILAAIPMIGNQLIQIIKDSAFLTIIAVPELTHEASSIQATYFVPFAAFVTAVLLYWLLCLIIEAAVAGIGRLAEARR